MKGTVFISTLFFLLFSTLCMNAQNDRIFPVKVSHAEPIYFDLIRDLGARKGERELNVGMGMSSNKSGAEHAYLVEYEFAPVNRLGLEVEVPLSFHNTRSTDSDDTENGVEGVKAAMQYSFFVSEKWRTTMAAGYIFERRLSHVHPGHEHMPFFIIAKRWGRQFHSMLFAGPSYNFETNQCREMSAIINASVHYMLPSTRNFIGIEINDEVRRHHNEMIVRPQVKMALSSSSSLGISLGISCDQSDKTMDFLVRWIYELKRKH